MIAFRVYLAALWVILIAYTLVVLHAHGADLVSVFFGDIAALGWPGQFNLDFLMMLTLSALWTAWRNTFSPAGLGLGFLALIGGASFLCVYLLVLSIVWKGEMRPILLGPSRAKDDA